MGRRPQKTDKRATFGAKSKPAQHHHGTGASGSGSSRKAADAIHMTAASQERLLAMSAAAAPALAAGAGGDGAAADEGDTPKMPSARRLERLCDDLAELGFSEDQVEQGLRGVGASASGFSKEAALDWLVVNLPNGELPGRFRGEDLVKREVEAGGISLARGLKKRASGGDGDGDADADAADGAAAAGTPNLLDVAGLVAVAGHGRLAAANRDAGAESSSDDSDDAGRAKARILEFQAAQEAADAENRKRAKQAAGARSMRGAEFDALPLGERAAIVEAAHADNVRLSEEWKTTWNQSERAQYNRRQKELTGQIRSLRRQEAAETARAAAAAAAAAGDDGAGDDGDGDCLAALMDDDAAAAAAAPAPTAPAAAARPPPREPKKRKKKVRPDPRSQPWSGKQPKVHLEEWCKRKRHERPRFEKLPGGKTCRVLVTLKTGELHTFDSDETFESFDDEMNLCATMALYEWNRGLRFHTSLPPAFREIWLTWDAKKDAAVAAVDGARREKKSGRMQLLAESLSKQQREKEKAARDRKRAAADAERATLSSAVARALSTTAAGAAPADLAAPAAAAPDDIKLEPVDDWEGLASSSDDGDDGGDAIVLDATGEEARPAAAGPAEAAAPAFARPFDARVAGDWAARAASAPYKRMAEARSVLPATKAKEALLDACAKSRVVVVCGDTGCGKTTQVPQLILEEALAAGDPTARIICTQPRRVAACSVAERVADEMAERCGGPGAHVGYQIRMEARRSASTRLLFCTTGVLLRRLMSEPTLHGVTHVVLDEVHERQAQADFLLILLRDLLRARSDLKLVLMSATIDPTLFVRYFAGFGHVPVLTIEGRTFPTAAYHLEDLLEATGHVIEAGGDCAKRGAAASLASGAATLKVTGKGGSSSTVTAEWEAAEVGSATGALKRYRDYSATTRRSLALCEETRINYDLIEDVLSHVLLLRSPVLVPPSHEAAGGGKGDADLGRDDWATLVFLPGMGEIRALHDRLSAHRVFGDATAYRILPLHSSVPSSEQRLVFQRPPPGVRKIVLATNIAETSVTIDDVALVVDAGLCRESRRSARALATQALVTDWCSRASAQQRRGRAGRVREGVCCRLYSSGTFEERMRASQVPELRRAPLEELCLQIKASHLGRCADFLGKALEPPPAQAVADALSVLREVGAISDPASGEDGDGERGDEETLTPLGTHLAKLPVHVRLGKMLIFGALFGCLDPVLTIAASLSTKSPFATPFGRASEAEAAHKRFVAPQSDFESVRNAWRAYAAVLRDSGENAARRFCQSAFLNAVALREMGDLRRQFLDLLRHIGFVKRDAGSSSGGGGGFPRGGGKGGGGDKRFNRSSGDVRGNGAAPSGTTGAAAGAGAGADSGRDLAGGAANNKQSSNPSIVAAVVCAGLYPHIIKAECRADGAGRASYFEGKHRVFMHKASVNAMRTWYTTPWLVYHEKVDSGGRLSCSGTAAVTPFALLLFGGRIRVLHAEGRVAVDEWITFSAPAKTAILFREARASVARVLGALTAAGNTGEGIEADHGISRAQCDAIVASIVDVLSGEGVAAVLTAEEDRRGARR